MRGRESPKATLFTLLAAVAAAQAPHDFSSFDVSAHRIAKVTWIRPKGFGFTGFDLEITVDKRGAITSVEVASGPESCRDKAIALVKTWKYKPFFVNGHPVPAKFTDYVFVYPPQSPLTRNVPFPAVHDWSTLRIALTRMTCFGTCPAYEVLISGNGDVLFQEQYPDQLERQSHISRKALESLVDVFRKANFFSLSESYRSGGTDAATYTTSISFDGQLMSVKDYDGLQIGMPDAVVTVEKAIDEAAGTSQWLTPP